MRFMAIERLLKSGKGKNIDSNSKNSLIDLIHSWGAGAGRSRVFRLLGAGAA